MRAGVFHCQPCFIGELAKIHLVPVGGLAEHADIGAGAEDVFFGGAQDDGADFGVLEPQPLHGVCQLNIDAKIVGIQLQLVAAQQRRIGIDIHRQRGDGTIERQFPVLVAAGVGLEVDHARWFRTKAAMDESVSACASRCGECRAPCIKRVSVGARAWRSRTRNCSSDP